MVRNISLIASACIFSAALAAETDTKHPNIVLFMVDDMGWQDTSVPFADSITPLNRRYHTPNMERLAAMGVKFTSAYAASISSPTRCSLITGTNAARHGVTNWTCYRDEATDEPDNHIILPQWNVNGVQPEAGIGRSFPATSFVQILRDNGYHTIHCGKAHFGAFDTPGADPLNWGFDINISGHAAGGLASYLGEKRYGHDADGNPVRYNAIPGLEKYWDTDVFATEALTREALAALKAAEDSVKPFFLYMSHYAVHVPIEADRRFIDKYLAAGLSDTEAAYATLVEGMDKSLGDIMDYLEQSGQMDNTVIIFMSDNGGLSALGRTPPLHVQNAPLRSGKGSVYEGGVREPMIVYWNGVTTPGSEIDDYLIIEDFYPSLLEIAGVGSYTAIQPLDGVSFVPLLKGARGDNDRLLVWNTPNTWIAGDYRAHGIGQTCAVRKGDYKLVYWYDNGRKELYDVKRDIGETIDISGLHPDLVEELSVDLGRYLRKVGALRPSFLDGTQCPFPDEEFKKNH